MGIKQGKGTTVTFVATEGSLAGVCITDSNTDGQSVEMLDGTKMDSPAMIKIANELVDYGTESITLLHDPTVDVQLLIGKTGTLTVTSPLSVTGNTTNESGTGTATMNNYTAGRSVGALMSSTVQFTWKGDDYSHVPES